MGRTWTSKLIHRVADVIRGGKTNNHWTELGYILPSRIIPIDQTGGSTCGVSSFYT
jgi:hypothetical protein